MARHRLIRRSLVTWGALLLVAFCSATFASAATLYERSRDTLALRAQKALPNDVTFVVLGDSRDNDQVFREALATAKEYDPLFILHMGDYSSQGTPEETERFLSLLGEEIPRVPCFVVFGNHEQRGVFEKKIGPRDYTLDLPRLGLRVVVVDNADNTLRPAELGYLREQLQTRRSAVFTAMHVPPRTSRWDWHSFSAGAGELARLLTQRHVTTAFYGHVHIYDRDEIGGVPSIITGGAGAPLTRVGYPGQALYHIIVVRVKNGTATATMVPINK